MLAPSGAANGPGKCGGSAVFVRALLRHVFLVRHGNPPSVDGTPLGGGDSESKTATRRTNLRLIVITHVSCRVSLAGGPARTTRLNSFVISFLQAMP